MSCFLFNFQAPGQSRPPFPTELVSQAVLDSISERCPLPPACQLAFQVYSCATATRALRDCVYELSLHFATGPRSEINKEINEGRTRPLGIFLHLPRSKIQSSAGWKTAPEPLPPSILRHDCDVDEFILGSREPLQALAGGEKPWRLVSTQRGRPETGTLAAIPWASSARSCDYCLSLIVH